MRLRALGRRAAVSLPIPELLLRYRARNLVTVFGYHRVLPRQGRDFPFSEQVISATPEEFARELAYMKVNLDVISIPELVAGLAKPSLLPRRPAVITFDDGYLDNHQFALPLLRDANLPACFFVCTRIVGTRHVPWYEAWVCCLKLSKVSRIESPFPNDPPYELDGEHLNDSIRRFRSHVRLKPWRQIPGYLQHVMDATGVNPEDHVGNGLFMSWDQVRQLKAAGMEIGGHTRTHPALSQVDDPAILRDQIEGCFNDLVSELGSTPLAFAYPFGYPEYMSEEADAEIQKAGFAVSFSFRNGFVDKRMTPRWRIPRIHASHVDDHQLFRFRTATAPLVR